MEITKYVKKFIDIGLTEREAKVYITLLTKKMFTASELQEIVDIPRTKIYEVLQKMVHRGICIERRLGRNKIYEAIKPEIAFQVILDNYQTELNRKKDVIQELNTTLSPIFEQNKDIVNPLDYIEVLNDNALIHKKYVSLVEMTNHELLTFNKGPYACDTSEKVEEQNEETLDLLKRGGISKGLYEKKELEQYKWLYDEEKQLTNHGHQAKIVDDLPVKMIVFDEKAVMFALNEPMSLSLKLTMISVEHNDIAKACKMLFNSVWIKGNEFDGVAINHQKYADI
jgi:HTH-type transcriptional regulator, sugar sensing transcriptional regulator